MAKPYREGKGWAVRVRTKGQDIYLKGFKSEAAAEKAAEKQRVTIRESGKPARMGPQRTSLALAWLAYAKERLPSLKGARQDAQRINRYLRAVGLPVIELESAKASSASGSVAYWKVTLADEPTERRIPNSLKQHRASQSAKSPKTDKLRAELARTPVAEITPYLVQRLIDAMGAEGLKPATIALERAELRRLFSYAQRTWLWPQPAINPATGLNMPSINNERTRIISMEEWERLETALKESGNPYAFLAVSVLLETTMRSSEPLMQARWRDVDWDNGVLVLPDAKAGGRKVPLNSAAMEALKKIQQRIGTVDPEANLFPTTYEALKKAWRVACKKAGVKEAWLHDIRRTGATRYAIQFYGSLPYVQSATGHKTVSQVMRYIQITAEHVSRVMRNKPLDKRTAPAGLPAKFLESPQPEPQPVPYPVPQPAPQQVVIALPAALPDNVVLFPGSGKRRVA